MRLPLLAAALLAAAGTCAQAQDARGAGIAVHFASREEARAALVADDEWMRTAGEFQRAAIARVRPPAAEARFKAAQAAAGRDCSTPERERWSAAIRAVAARVELLRLLPRVTVVCTDGSDSSDAPYTRGDAVFMPQNVRQGWMSDEELAVHELFHIVSRRNPDLATRLYALLGFEPAGELEWPAEWAAQRISNPDAPHHRHVMRLPVNGAIHAVMPVLVASRAVEPGESYFQVLQVRLLAVNPGAPGAASRPVRDAAGALVWLHAERSVDYLRQLGGNTPYIFHPEETMADNVAFLASGRPVPNPALMARIRAVIADALRAPNPERTTP